MNNDNDNDNFIFGILTLGVTIVIGVASIYSSNQNNKIAQESNKISSMNLVISIIGIIITLIAIFLFIPTSEEDLDVVNYYEDGTLHFTGNGLVEDKEDTWKYYSRDGIIIKVENYNNSKLDGDYKEFYENGNLKISGEYDNGEVLLSNWKCFHMDGTIKECLEKNHIQ